MHESLGMFLNCGVDLFIFISGYLYGIRGICEYKKWYARRALTVSLPAIVVSIVFMIVLQIFNHTVSLNQLILYLFDLEGLLMTSWKIVNPIVSGIPGLGPLWFTTVIMLCYLLVPLLQRISVRIKNYYVVISLVFSIGIILSFITDGYFSLVYFTIFIIGYLCGQIRILEKVNNVVFIASSVLFLISALGRLYLHRIMDDTIIYSSYVTVQTIIAGLYVVVFISYAFNKYPKVIIRIANKKTTRLLEKYSFFVYLTHGVFCMGYFNVYEKTSLLIATCLFVFGTIISSVLIRLVTNLCSKPFLKLLK